MNAFRKRGIVTLQKFLKNEKNIKLVETYINKYTRNEKEYWSIMYEVIGILLKPNCLGNKTGKEIIQSIIMCIHNDSFGWDHPVYSEFKSLENEQTQFKINPIEVEEGILECGKCHSKKTISYQKQLRSCDESSSTFAQCVICNNKWREN